MTWRGILIVPVAEVHRVIDSAEEVSQKESVVRASLQQGGDIHSLFEQDKAF